MIQRDSIGVIEKYIRLSNKAQNYEEQNIRKFKEEMLEQAK